MYQQPFGYLIWLPVMDTLIGYHMWVPYLSTRLLFNINIISPRWVCFIVGYTAATPLVVPILGTIYGHWGTLCDGYLN